MNKLSDLLIHVNLKEEDYKNIAEEPLTIEELDILKQITFKAIQEDLKGKDELKLKDESLVLQDKIIEINDDLGTKSYKRRKKKRLLFLVAILIFTCVASLIANVKNGNVERMFEVLFGSGTAYIGESGLELGVNTTKEGITLNVQGLVGDKNSAILLFDLTKEDGSSFDGNYIKFGRLEFDVEGKHEKTRSWNPFKIYGSQGYTSSIGWGMLDEVYQVPTKYTFKVEANLTKDLIGKNATLKLTDIIEAEQGDWFSEINLAEFLRAYPEYTYQDSIPMEEKFISYYDEEELESEGMNAQEVISKIPKRGLDSKQLDINLYPDFNTEWKIDNLGFVDGKLHLRMYGTDEMHYTPSFVDEQGNEIEMEYNITTYHSNGEGAKEERFAQGYYVYAIKDLEELSKLRVRSWFIKELRTTKGEWQLSFKVAIKNEEKRLVLNKMYSQGDSLTLEELTLSKLSLQVIYENKNNKRGTIKTRLLMKDGQEIKLGAKSQSYEGSKVTVRYAFKEPIDISEVQAVFINNEEVKIE
ncbi:hypothetical protein CS063_15320 [Sporanaerobium hydrogeniformans]|uniref:Uncharacterized protein n=1 Tax=Sporanaerobium hydrogeniformans TaxID=3072179 RepID=A0AC61D9N6_9FIRM|nr:hypothetical protein [Sporanaerobium hydrogeniformans]PHV69545.1 hypothetical protein CS063_15320 [Sporanaerobium hydrogeniformans]